MLTTICHGAQPVTFGYISLIKIASCTSHKVQFLPSRSSHYYGSNSLDSLENEDQASFLPFTYMERKFVMRLCMENGVSILYSMFISHKLNSEGLVTVGAVLCEGAMRHMYNQKQRKKKIYPYSLALLQEFREWEGKLENRESLVLSFSTQRVKVRTWEFGTRSLRGTFFYCLEKFEPRN